MARWTVWLWGIGLWGGIPLICALARKLTERGAILKKATPPSSSGSHSC